MSALNGALQTIWGQAQEIARLRRELARTRALFELCDEQRRELIRERERSGARAIQAA